MFTWICPTCGREVPPAYDACPDCAAREKAAQAQGLAEAAAPLPPAAPTPAAPPPPAPYTPPAVLPPAVAPPPAYYAAPPQRAALPTWLLAILFSLAFIGLGAGVYWLVQYFGGGSQAAASAPVETVPVRGQAKQHPLQKYVEVTGIRFVQAAKKDTEARFLVVNHSGADIADLAGTVNIWGRTAKSEEEAAGNFSFKVPTLGPYESKEVTAPVITKLKVYELPDWQNVSTEVQITSP
jgi:hypothetical protein